MSEKVSREDVVAALQAFEKARDAFNTAWQKYWVFWWPESGEPPPTDEPRRPRPVSDELQRLASKRQEMWEVFVLISRAYEKQS